MKTNWVQRVRRLAAMGGAELSDRARQELQKRADAIRFSLHIQASDLETCVADMSGAFFFGPESIAGIVQALRERFPRQVEAIRKGAEKICEHRFDLLGYENLDYGQKIDWHLDCVHGKRAARKLWFKVQYLDFASVGDAKIIWELNRHQHLVTLAKAYRLTSDSRFADEILAQWSHWWQENPYPWGVNWASSLEVAFRCLSWVWVYFLLEGTAASNAQFRRQWIQGLEQGGRHIERYLSTYFSPNTHLLGEAVALFFIGVLFPGLNDAPRWMAKGWKLILQESEQQVRADGFHFEQSTYYHVYALDLLLHSRILAFANKIEIPVELDRKLKQMLDALAVLCRAGTPPRWGDDDGGRVFDPRRNKVEHLSDSLATGAVLFRRGDFKFLASNLREETVWLLGPKAVAEFDALESQEPTMESLPLSSSGLYLMSCSKRRLQAVIDAGPQGALTGGHGHADSLSLTVHVCGQEILGHPGTYAYVGSRGEREEFRSTAAHNTIRIDGSSQSEPMGPFGWERLTQAKVELWRTSERFDLFVGSHDGYSRGSAPVIHRRSVFFQKPHFWLVRDTLVGTGTHQVDICWQVNPELTCLRLEDASLYCGGKNAGVLIYFVQGNTWSKMTEPSSWSPAYGKREAALRIRCTTETRIPTEFATLLVPTDKPPEVGTTAKALTHSYLSACTSIYCFTEENVEHCFVFSEEDWIFEKWESDSQFMYYRRTADRILGLAFCNASYVRFRGKHILAARERVPQCEIDLSDGNLEIVGASQEIVVSPGSKLLFNPLLASSTSIKQVNP